MSNGIGWSPEGLIRYPDWAPEGVINMMHFNSEEGEILEFIRYRLMTDPRMERVWSMLLKKVERSGVEYEGLPHGREWYTPLELLHYTYKSLVFAVKPHNTRAIKVEKYKDISELSNKLARKIAASDIDKSPFSWLPDSVIESMVYRTIGLDIIIGSDRVR